MKTSALTIPERLSLVTAAKAVIQRNDQDDQYPKSILSMLDPIKDEHLLLYLTDHAFDTYRQAVMQALFSDIPIIIEECEKIEQSENAKDSKEIKGRRKIEESGNAEGSKVNKESRNAEGSKKNVRSGNAEGNGNNEEAAYDSVNMRLKILDEKLATMRPDVKTIFETLSSGKDVTVYYSYIHPQTREQIFVRKFDVDGHSAQRRAALAYEVNMYLPFPEYIDWEISLLKGMKENTPS